AIMTETVPAGLLPQIGLGLGVSEALAGQLVTLFAAGSVLAAIPIIAATRGWNRRPLLLLAIGGLCIFNVVTALSAHYALALAARFGGGMAAGLLW
ncbi:MFS transporter, partial [Escherichia coli]